MSYYEDDFYSEPSEFEAQVDEFKQSLIKAVKTEYQEEMERLRKENKELNIFKKRKEEMEREHQEKLRKVELDKKQFERDLKYKRLSELLGENMLIGYSPKAQYSQKPKCDKCDDARHIHFKSPSGKDCYEDCPYCHGIICDYIAAEKICYKFAQSKKSYGDNKFPMWIYFKFEDSKDSETYESCTDIYHGEEFDKVNSYRIIFFNKADCERYCEWLNNKTNQN